MVGFLGLGIGNRPAQGVGLEENIGVGEEQPVASRLFTRDPHGVRLAQPAGRQFCNVDNSQLAMRFRPGRNLIHDLAGVVGGAVVDRNHFKVGILESQQAGEGFADMRFFVASRNDDADARLAIRSCGVVIPFRPGDVCDFWHSQRGIDDPGEPGQRQNRACDPEKVRHPA